MPTCSIEGCQTVEHSRICAKHRARIRKYGTPDLPDRPPKVCSVDGCAEPMRARDLCSKHYQRLTDRGTVEANPLALRGGEPHGVRFWAKVQIGSPDECWPWLAARDSKGYGRWVIRGERSGSAHRYAYEITFGPVPAGLQLDHLCRVTSCVNPVHLEPVTGAENMRRRAAAQTHCKRGHEFTSENTKVTSQGSRQCLACVRLLNRQRRRRAA